MKFISLYQLQFAHNLNVMNDFVLHSIALIWHCRNVYLILAPTHSLRSLKSAEPLVRDVLLRI